MIYDALTGEVDEFTSDTLEEVVREERRDRTVFYFDPGTGERRLPDDVLADPYFYSKYPSEKRIEDSPCKRFIVMSGDEYYPAGGFRDRDTDCDSLQEALGFLMGLEQAPDWAHALDTQTRIVYDLLTLRMATA